MENLLGVLLGALIAASAGLVGLSISKRNEHDQWTRNQKLEVYSALLKSADDMYLTHEWDSNTRIERALRLQDAMTRASLLASEAVWDKISAAQQAILVYQTSEGFTDPATQGAASDRLAELKQAVTLDLHRQGSVVDGDWVRFAGRHLSK